MNKETKRYLIAYDNNKTGLPAISKLLDVADSYIKDGVAAMVNGGIPGDDDILHFKNSCVISKRMTQAEADKLSSEKGITAICPDMEISLPDEEFVPTVNKPGPTGKPTPQWNMQLVKAPEAWQNGYQGSGIKVAIVDTGISDNPDLVIAGGVSFVPGEPSWNDDSSHGHGTHCAGIVGARGLKEVYGVAPQCTLYAVKISKGDETAPLTRLTAAMDWCMDSANGIQVVSCSFAIKEPPTSYMSKLMAKYQQKLVMVFCTGNSYREKETVFNFVNYPANSFLKDVPEASPIAVGSVDRYKKIAPTSSRGGAYPDWNPVTVVAPGVSIDSTTIPGTKGNYSNASGTSMACAHVAGLAALILGKSPSLTPADVMSKITTTAKNLGKGNPNETYGYGLINCEAATT